MDSQKPNTRMRGGKGTISLETYLDFIDSQRQLDLTINYLNQIVAMHGYKMLYKVPKKAIIDAVNTIDLMNPARSTLKDNISFSSAYLTTEEVIADLNSLNWQECTVTSVQVINLLNEDPSTQQQQQLSLQFSEHPQSKSNPNSRSVADVYNHGFDGTSNSNSVCSSEVGGSAKKLAPKRKRKALHAVVDRVGDCGVAHSGTSTSSQLLLGSC